MRLRLFLAVSVALAGWACSEALPEPEDPWVPYPLTGKIVQLQDGETKIAVVDHEEIEGWMGAMTMGFSIENADQFAKLSEGDQIEATVMVRGDLEYYLDEITVVEAASVTAP